MVLGEGGDDEDAAVLTMQIAANIIPIIEKHFNVSSSGAAQQQTEEQPLVFRGLNLSNSF